MLHSLGSLAYAALSILLALRAEEGQGLSLPLNCAVSVVHGLCFLIFSAAILRGSWVLQWARISCFLWAILLILAPWHGIISTLRNSRADLAFSSSLWQEELAVFGLAVVMNAAVISLVPIGRITRFLMIGTFSVSHVVVCGLLAHQAPIAAASRAIVVLGQAAVLVFGAYEESQKVLKAKRVHRVAQEAQRIEGEELQKAQDALFQTQASLQVMMEETCTQVLRMRSDFIFGQHVAGDDVLGVATSPTSISALDCLPLAHRANLMAAAVTKMGQAIGTLEALQTNLILSQQEQKAKMLLVHCSQHEPRFLVGVCLEKPQPVISGLTPGSTPVSPQVTAELTGGAATPEGSSSMAPSSSWQSLTQGLYVSSKQKPVNPPMEPVKEDGELVVGAQQEGEGRLSDGSSGHRSPFAVVGSQQEGEGRPSDGSSGKRSANFGDSESSSLSFKLSSSEGSSPPSSLPGTPLRGDLSMIPGCSTPHRHLLFQPPKEFKDVEVITDIVAGDLGRFRCRCCAKPPLPPGALTDSPRSQTSRGGSPKMKRRSSFVGRGTPLSRYIRAIAAGSSPVSSDSEDSQGTKPYGRSSSSRSEDSERERRSVLDAFSGTWRVAEGQPEVMPWLACFTICRGEARDGEGQKCDLEYKDGMCFFAGGVLTRVQGSPVLMRVGRSGRPLMFVQVAAVDEPSQDQVSDRISQLSGPKRRSSTKQSLEEGNMYAVTPGGSS